MGTTNFDAIVLGSSNKGTAGTDGALTGNVTGDVTGDVTGSIYQSTITTYVADGAIALTDNLAILDGSSASCAMTLAAGTAGQIIYIKAIDVSNTCDVDPASFIDGTTITFTPANEYAVLMSDGTSWYMVGGDGAVT